jgi:DNA-binding response OmpR family regulator
MRHLILVVEEDPVLGEFLGAALEGEGYTPCIVTDRTQALQLIDATPPSLILLDYCDFSDDLLRSTQERATPIVMLSSIEASLAVNADHGSRRPFDLSHLLTVIASSLPPDQE